MIRHVIDVRMRLDTSLLIASGSPRWGADLATTVDEEGYPVIPGTSLRGRLRHITRGVARAIGLFTCDEPTPERMCGSNQPDADQPGVASVLGSEGAPIRVCPVCRLFGSPGALPSRVMVSDVRLKKPGKKKDEIPAHQFTRVRNHVAINRKRRTAEHGKLFAVEASSPGLASVSYEGSVTVSLPPEDQALMGLLVAAMCQLYAVGGHNTRGYGWLVDPSVGFRPDTESVLTFRCQTYDRGQAESDLHALRQLAGEDA
ncbi:MAG: hypothetical protein HPY44_18865 [Armatimonadetes bacterium]|nr:hypothetical protein [Armatimonadota bacterium]